MHASNSNTLGHFDVSKCVAATMFAEVDLDRDVAEPAEELDFADRPRGP